MNKILLGALALLACSTSSAHAYTLEQLRDNAGNRLKLPAGRWADYLPLADKLRAGTYEQVLALAAKPKPTLQEAALALYFAASKGAAAGKVTDADSLRFMFAAADVYLDPMANINVARLSQRGSGFAGLRQPTVDMTFRYLNRAWETGQVFTDNGVGTDIWEMIAGATLGLADGFDAADINDEYPTSKTLDRLRPELLAFRNSFARLYGLKVPTTTTTVFERHYARFFPSEK